MKVAVSLLIVYAGFSVSFVLNRYLAQHLDLDGLGDFQVALSVASIMAVLIIFGGQSAVHRFIPQYLSQDQWGKARGFIGHYLKLVLKLGAAAVAVSLVAAGAFKYFGLENLLHESLLAIVITPLIALSLFTGAAVQSLRRPIAAILPHELLKPLLFLLGCLLWVQFFSTFNEYEAIGILFVASAIQLAVQVYLLKRALPFSWRETQPVYDNATWHKVSIPLLGSTLANVFLDRIDVLALELLHPGEHAVGVFSLLIFISSPVWMNFNTVSNLISPRISMLDDDAAGRQRLFNNAFGFLILSNLAVASLIWFFADPILGWFHGDMPAFKPWLLVVLGGAVVNCAMEVASPFIRFGGHQDKAAKLAGYILIANLIVTPTAVLLYGMEGAIVSLVGMSFIRGLAYMIIMRKYVGIKPLRVV